MSEISREEAMEHLKNYNCWIYDGYSWIDDVVRKAISDMEKMNAYETKLKKVYGECNTLLDTAVDGLIKQAEEHKIGKPIKARLLTDEDVDKWEQSKSDREKLEKIEQIVQKYNLQDVTRDDVDDIISGFEYEIIMAVLGKDIE